MNSKSLWGLFATLATMVAFADPSSPQVTLGPVTQDPATHLVTASYTLDEPAVITFDVKTNGVTIGGANLTHAYGDVHRVVGIGVKHGKDLACQIAVAKLCKAVGNGFGRCFRDSGGFGACIGDIVCDGAPVCAVRAGCDGGNGEEGKKRG